MFAFVFDVFLHFAGCALSALARSVKVIHYDIGFGFVTPVSMKKRGACRLVALSNVQPLEK